MTLRKFYKGQAKAMLKAYKMRLRPKTELLLVEELHLFISLKS